MQPPPLHVVTGATRGIGRAVALELTSRGLPVIAVGRALTHLESLAEAAGALLTGIQANLATEAGIERVRSSIPPQSQIGGIVHAAGSLVPLEPYAELNPLELVEHFRIHVATPIALFNTLRQQHAIKRILFIDSYSASAARLGWSAYSIVKAAAQMAARCAAQELLPTRSIRAYPGAVNTQIVDAVLASNTDTAHKFAEMKKKGEFAEPAAVAKFLTALLVDATDEELNEREVFDYNNAEDRAKFTG